jgi:hypothetical protein
MINFEVFDDIKMEMYPFPHFIIENVLDWTFLKLLRDEFPKDLIRMDKESSKGRFTLIHNSKKFKKLMSRSKPWKSFLDKMGSDLFQVKIKDLYKKTDDFANLGNLDGLNLSLQMDLSFAGKDYQRSIHLDRNHHFFNSFIYLNGHEDFGGTGGELRLHEVFNRDGIYDKFPEEEDIRYTKTIAIKENSLVGFFCCPYSYHSVVHMKDSIATRDFIYCALNESSGLDLWPQAKIISEKRRQRFLKE